MIGRSYVALSGYGIKRKSKPVIGPINKSIVWNLMQRRVFGIVLIGPPIQRRLERKTGPTMPRIVRKFVRKTERGGLQDELKNRPYPRNKKNAVLGAANTKDGRQ